MQFLCTSLQDFGRSSKAGVRLGHKLFLSANLQGFHVGPDTAAGSEPQKTYYSISRSVYQLITCRLDKDNDVKG